MKRVTFLVAIVVLMLFVGNEAYAEGPTPTASVSATPTSTISPMKGITATVSPTVSHLITVTIPTTTATKGNNNPSVAGDGISNSPVISSVTVVTTTVEIKGANLLPVPGSYGQVVGYASDFPWGYGLASFGNNVITWTENTIQFTYSSCVPFVKGYLYVIVGNNWSNSANYTLTLSSIVPDDVVISNLTDRSATVSFLTKVPACSNLVYWASNKDWYSTLQSSTNQVAWPESKTHWIQAGWGELQAQTAYKFNLILNGQVSYTGTFTTTAVPSLSIPDSAYGYVQTTSGSPVSGALVYLSYTVGVSNTPILLSTYSDEKGTWLVNRNSSAAVSTASTNVSGKVTVQGSGGNYTDTIELRAVNSDGQGYLTLSKSFGYWPVYLVLRQIRTVDIRLGPGFNAIGLPVEPFNNYRVSDMIAATGDSIKAVYQYSAYGWSGAVVQYGTLFGENAYLWPGQGLMVQASRPTTITITGYLPYTNTRYLQAGWNLISWPLVNGSLTASNVSDDAGKDSSGQYYISEVDRWAYGGYEGHITGLPFNNFSLEEDKGYFVKAKDRGVLFPGQGYRPYN